MSGLVLFALAVLLDGVGTDWAPMLFWLSLAMGSMSPIRELWPELARGRLSIDFLMVVAALGAGCIGHPGEGALLLILFNLAEWLEERAMERTRLGVRALLEGRPTLARRWRDSTIEEVPVSALLTDDRVEVLAGEVVPVDGEIEQGSSHFDQSFLTGESLPVYRTPGECVLAGTLNLDSTVIVRCSTRPGNFLADRIVSLVTEAQERQTRAQSFIERYGSVYAWGLSLTALGWGLIGWLWGGLSPAEGAYQGLVLLVVASPCALVLAEPAALLSAMSRAARAGILIKGGCHLSPLAQARTLLLDKTGTLTTGDFELIGWHSSLQSEPDRFLAIGAGVAAHSTHPVARPLVEEAGRRGLEIPTAVEAVTTWGQGLTVRAGEVWRLGQRDFVQTNSRNPDEGLAAQAEECLKNGETLVYLGSAEEIGFFRLRDRVRPEAAGSLSALRKLGLEQQALVSGDSQPLVDLAAREAGIARASGGLMPHQKSAVLDELGGGQAWMVGDGVNDSPAIAGASVGVAFGQHAAGAALESADVVVLAPDLRQLVFLRRLALGHNALCAPI